MLRKSGQTRGRYAPLIILAVAASVLATEASLTSCGGEEASQGDAAVSEASADTSLRAPDSEASSSRADALPDSSGSDVSDASVDQTAWEAGSIDAMTTDAGQLDGMIDAGCGDAVSCGSACVDPRQDPANCGRCGHACQGGTCEAGSCQPVLIGTISGPFGIAVNADGVYVTSPYVPGSVVRFALDGGSPNTVSSGGAPEFITANDAGVFWLEADFGADAAAITVVRTFGEDGGPATLATVPNVPSGIAVDSSNVYWSSDYGGTSPSMGAYRVAIDGGSPELLEAGTDPLGVAVDATNFYWVEGYGGTVNQMPLSGGPVTVLATGQPQPITVAVSPTTVYWGSEQPYVGSVPIDGGLVSHISLHGGPMDLALDTLYAYVANDNNALYALPLDGGPPTVLVSNVLATRVAVNPTSVYWVGDVIGIPAPIMMVAKP